MNLDIIPALKENMIRSGSSLDSWRSRMWYRIHGRDVECLSPEEVCGEAEREVEREGESRVVTAEFGHEGGLLMDILGPAKIHPKSKHRYHKIQHPTTFQQNIKNQRKFSQSQSVVPKSGEPGGL